MVHASVASDAEDTLKHCSWWWGRTRLPQFQLRRMARLLLQGITAILVRVVKWKWDLW